MSLDHSVNITGQELLPHERMDWLSLIDFAGQNLAICNQLSLKIQKWVLPHSGLYIQHATRDKSMGNGGNVNYE